jgi:PAS domain S-box-containing protein
MSVDHVVRTTIDEVAAAMGSDLALFFLRTEETLELAAFGPADRKLAPDFWSAHCVGKCLCGLAAQTGNPLYSMDISSDARCTWEECKKAGLRSFAALPLSAEGKVLGILGLAAAQPFDFAAYAPFLETLAAEVALGLRNALLMRRTVTVAQQLETEVNERSRSEAELRSLIDNAPYGITRASRREDRFLSVNPALVRMLGYASPQAVLALKLSRDLYCSPNGRTDFLSQLPSAGGFNGIELHWRRRDGQAMVVRASGRVVPVPETDDLIIEGIAEDVSRERLLEEELVQAQKMEALGRLAGGVAHDFNNLLGVILGYSELLSKDLADSPVLQKRVEAIRKAGERAAGLTAQLLSLSRRQAPQTKVFCPNAVVADTDQMLRRLIGEDVELKLRLANDLGKIKSNPAQIVQVIMNLVVNARDAMPGGGMLTVETYNAEIAEEFRCRGAAVRPGPYVVLAVTDSGMGMDKATQARIFAPFFTTKAVGEGTGLGLATVNEIVARSAGHIFVESAPGRGSTFTVYFPRIDEEAEAPADLAGAVLVRGNETILLVEDAAALREFIQESLQLLGYRVLPAAGGREALEIARQHPGPIHLMITDMILPSMSGPELVQTMTELRPGTQMLQMSGHADATLTRVAGPRVTLIQKPFTLSGLSAKIREALGTSKAGQ